MAQATYVQEGARIPHVAGSAISYGDVVPLVGHIGVAAADIASGAEGELAVAGVFEAAAVNNAAFVVGDALYWDDTANKLTKTAQGNTAAGWATEAKAESGTTARVKIG
jgi:predicted RecA/RadA family phage recombinase